MSENTQNPSAVEITEAKITSYDGSKTEDITSGFIGSFELVQSMSMVSYEGKITVLDYRGILEQFPLRGEETLSLKIKSLDIPTEINLKTHIYKITDIKPTDDVNGASYTLHFVSKETFKASTRVITSSYRKSVHDIVKEIFNDTYGKLAPTPAETDLSFRATKWSIIRNDNRPTGRNFIIQPATDRSNKLIIPKLSPSEAMYFLASRGYSTQTPSQTFRFFETFENYYFCTDEYFVKDIANEDVIELHYSPVGSMAINASEQLKRIDNLQIVSKGIDTATDIFSGSYRNTVTQIDLLRRKVENLHFNYDEASYYDMSGERRNTEIINPHTRQFRADTFTRENAKQFIIFKDYTGNGDNPAPQPSDRHFAEIVQNRVSYYHHLNNTVLAASLKGRLDIRPGMIVHLNITALDPNSGGRANQSLSGRYLVQSTSHSMNKDNTLSTGLRLAKFDWSGTSRDLGARRR